MNCQEALELLYDIIDKEASEIDVQQVQEHLKLCRHCAGLYRVESSVQELVTARLKSDNPSPKLDQLKSKVLNQLDSIDQEMRDSSRGRPPFFRLSTSLALAASLVLVIGAAFVVSGFYRHSDLYMPLEEAHFAVAGQPAHNPQGVVSADCLDYLNENLHYLVSHSVNDFQLSGGEIEEIMDTKMAHFAFHDSENKCVSVFVTDASDFEIPDDLQGNAVVKGDLTLYDHNCRGCRLVYHRLGNVIVITAATDHAVDLLSFVPGSLII